MNDENLDLRHRETEKEQACQIIEAALAHIERAHREPDKWERVHLVEAISAVFRGAYGLAAVDVESAMTPPGDRGHAALPNDPIYDRSNIALLRKALAEARAEPVRAYPNFGPIILTNNRAGG